MLNRTAWRYLSSRPLRRVDPRALAVVRVDNSAAWLLSPFAPLRPPTRASTNPASCVFFFRQFDRHASSSSSPRAASPPPSLSSSTTDRKRCMRETSPLTASTATESSHLSQPTDDEELGDASTELLPVVTLSWRERAKTFAVEYGRVGIVTHLVLSVVSISVIYAVISSGVDVSGLLKWLGMSTDSTGKDSAATSAGSFILAYAIYKVSAPLRWPLTFAVTPVVLRALRRRGYMLPAIKTSEHRSPRPNAEDRGIGNGHDDDRRSPYP